MIKLLNHLKQNWIKYGFETFTIIVGIFGALTIESWNDARKQQKDDLDFLLSLRNEMILDTTNISIQLIEYIGINNQIEKTLFYFDNNSDLSDSEYEFIGSTLVQLEMLTPAQQNVLRNDLVISGGVLNRIDKELNQRFLNYLEKIKWHNSVVTKLGETLQDVMVHDIHSRVDLQYIDSLNITIKYEFNKIKKDRLIRNALNKSFGYRRVYTSRINAQLDEAAELLSMINKHLEI